MTNIVKKIAAHTLMGLGSVTSWPFNKLRSIGAYMLDGGYYTVVLVRWDAVPPSASAPVTPSPQLLAPATVAA